VGDRAGIELVVGTGSTDERRQPALGAAPGIGLGDDPNSGDNFSKFAFLGGGARVGFPCFATPTPHCGPKEEPCRKSPVTVSIEKLSFPVTTPHRMDPLLPIDNPQEPRWRDTARRRPKVDIANGESEQTSSTTAYGTSPFAAAIRVGRSGCPKRPPSNCLQESSAIARPPIRNFRLIHRRRTPRKLEMRDTASGRRSDGISKAWQGDRNVLNGLNRNPLPRASLRLLSPRCPTKLDVQPTSPNRNPANRRA